MSEYQSVNSAEEIKNLALKAAGTINEITVPDGRQFIVHPPMFVVKEISLPQNVLPPMPKYINEGVEIQTVTALIDYVERFKTDNTVIFADIDEDRIQAVIDYHGKDNTAAITSHRATLALKKSLQWSLWNRASGSMTNQAEFAKFIEENSEDISSPTGAQLLEMILDLEKSKSIRVVRKLRSAGSDDGKADISVEMNGTELPSKFLLSIPVYFGEKPVTVTAFTRDALNAETKMIKIGLQLSRVELIRQTEFLRISSEIAEATGVPMIAGSIEAV